jgi:arylsulfatase A-like enzyme
MGNETTRHGVNSFESMIWSKRLRRMAGRARSEVVQLPDHNPGLVEHAIDVTEEPVEEGLHGELLMSVVADAATIAEHCCSRFSQA